MAIIQCSNCGRRLSSFATVCPHCDFPQGEVSAEEQERIRARRRKEQLYRAANLSYLALVLVVIGGIWWWFDSPGGLTYPPPMGGVGLVGGGITLYLVARGWALWLRFNSRR